MIPLLFALLISLNATRGSNPKYYSKGEMKNLIEASISNNN